eukprot:m.225090 g.225090  ORF g.225090 m.225090 type:complete len:445 (-) comp16618_c0_seq1:31-1365(-)
MEPAPAFPPFSAASAAPAPAPAPADAFPAFAAAPAPTSAAPAPAPAPAPAGDIKAETSKGAIAEKFAQASLLDMVFVMDCTGSMGSYIASAQQTIADIIEQIVAAEKADVRFGLVAYRDHPPQESTFVTNVYPFSSSVKTMRTNLNQLSANGGGDGPEAVVDGLHAALKLDYRDEATKVVILIADAPPHGLGTGGDGFPNGCPCELDPMAVCRQMAEANISLYCIGCEPSINASKNFFMAMAHVTGGQYCPLGDAHVLSSAVVSGVREEMSLAAALAEVKVAVAASEHMDEAMQAEFVHKKLKEKNVRAKQMKQEGPAGSAAPAAPVLTPDAIAMSKATSLADIRGKYSMGDYGAGGYGGGERSFMACAAPGGAMPMMAMSCAAMPAMAPSPSSRSRMSHAAAAPSFAGAPPAPSAPSSYGVMEADVSMEQTARLMNKARFQKK